MTEIVVATRDGILRAPDGTKYRMVRGKTLADARHPGVLANPGSFMPMEVHLSVEGTDPGRSDDGTAAEVAELEESLEQATAESEAYKAQLVAIVDILMAHGHVTPDTDTDEPGWVAGVVQRLAQPVATTPGPLPEEEDVPPPAPARARKPRATHG